MSFFHNIKLREGKRLGTGQAKYLGMSKRQWPLLREENTTLITELSTQQRLFFRRAPVHLLTSTPPSRRSASLSSAVCSRSRARRPPPSRRQPPQLTWQVRPSRELHESVELAGAPTPAGRAGPASPAGPAGRASSPPAVSVPALGSRHGPLTIAAAWSRQREPRLLPGLLKRPGRQGPGERRTRQQPMAGHLSDRKPMSSLFIGR